MTHYVRLIESGPSRQHAAARLQGWLTEQMVDNADPGDYGALYCVWADLEDVADAFEDGATFDQVASLAAQEWLTARTDPALRADWLTRWHAWLATYGHTHTVFWQRPGFTPPAADRYAALVAWAVQAMDGPFVPYSAAQKVLEAVDDDPQQLDDMPGAEALRAALRDVDESPVELRGAGQARVRALLLGLASDLGVQR